MAQNNVRRGAHQRRLQAFGLLQREVRVGARNPVLFLQGDGDKGIGRGYGGPGFLAQSQHPDVVEGHGRGPMRVKDLYRGFCRLRLEADALGNAANMGQCLGAGHERSHHAQGNKFVQH